MIREPCSIVSMSPPHSLILIASTGLPDLPIASATMRASVPSHPSPTTRTPA